MARAELAVNAQSHDESASVLVAAAIDCAHRTNRRMAEIRAQLLRAVLLLRAGEQQQAAELAYSQLQLANSLGMRRIFYDLTPGGREGWETGRGGKEGGRWGSTGG